jgi:beta-lactam-binding protein with PASTA domain
LWSRWSGVRVPSATPQTLEDWHGTRLASVVDEPTTDQNEDGIVVGEDPAAGTSIPSGSLVTIYVGRFSG